MISKYCAIIGVSTGAAPACAAGIGVASMRQAKGLGVKAETLGARTGKANRARPDLPRRLPGASGLVERLVDVGENIVYMLDPHRNTHQILRYAGLGQFFGRQLAVRGRSGMAGQ